MVNILFVLLIGAGVAINESEAVMEAVMACKEEFNMTREQLTSGDDSEQVKCFAECIMKKTGCMDDNGNLNEEKMTEEGNKFAKTEEQKRAFETAAKGCLEKNKAANPTGKCEKAYKLFICMRKEAMAAMQ